MLSIDIEARIGELDLRVQLPEHDGTTVVVGPNGAGKSSMLLTLLGAIRPLAGSIRLGGETLYDSASGTDRPTEHRRLGYLPQRYALFPHMTVAANVGYGVRDRARRARRVSELLEDLGIAHLGARKTRRLSGGESQRVALARALAIGPGALLLDEPMAALDAGARRQVRGFLAVRLRAIGIPTLVVSHDIEDAEVLGGRVAVLEQGRIVQLGTLDELRAAPATPFVSEFVCPEPATPPASVSELGCG